MICKLSFEGYFLIVADFVNWAKENDIPVGPGRGSGAGSITAYALGITAIDPLRYDLLFERFLNPDRVSNPDFDIDFCMEGRDRVLEYVTEKYGKDSVAQISTRGTMAARAVLRDVVRVLGKPYGFGDKLAKAIPDVLGISLDEAYKEKEFKELIESSEESKEVFDMSLKLEGLSRSVGTHAAGVVITPGPLTNYVPLFKNPSTGDITTQVDMKGLEDMGLLKMDFLGLRNLTVIDKTVKLINKRHNQNIDISKVSLDDKEVYKNIFSDANTVGVFQLESSGMKRLVSNMQPTAFEDIVAILALYRPGPLGSGMVEDYVQCKHKKKKVVFPHPLMENILKETYGVLVYQDQIIQSVQVLAGFSLGEADLLRRAIGKKTVEVLAAQRIQLVEG